MDCLTFNSLREKVSSGKIEEVLKILDQFCTTKKKDDLRDEINLHQSHLALLENLISRGGAEIEKLISTKQRITYDILSKIKALEEVYGKDFVLSNKTDVSNNENEVKENIEILKELAQELVFNHFTVSFGDSMSGELEKRCHEVLDGKYAKIYWDLKDQRRRNIVLIGAGATHQSCPYIPFGPRLKNFLEASENKNDKQIVEESNIKKRRGYYYDGKFDPERYLGLVHDNLGNESQYKLRAFLHNVYNRRYMPTHSYEIIAHMFKHSFCPVIINFNFDELLDEAIEEEMGNQKYYKILHDGDIPKFEDLFIDGRLKTPVYIKIHGTASQKSSLKFSENHDLYLSQDMKDFIAQLLGGQIINLKKSKPDEIPVNLISIGFDMERFGFNEQIGLSQLPEKSKWFQINWNKKMPDIEISGGGQKKYTLTSKHIKLSKLKPKNDNIPPLADLLIMLYEENMSKVFKPSYPPKGISRHLIIPNLFYLQFEHGRHEDFEYPQETIRMYKKLIEYFTSSAYFFERTVVETAILIIKNKGIIEPREAAREKVGFFYSKYKEKYISNSDEFKRRNKKPSGELPYERELWSLNQIYDIFKMENRYSFSNNLINLSPFDEKGDKWMEADQNILDDLCSSTELEKVTKSNLNEPRNLPVLVFYRLRKSMKHMKLLKNLSERFSTDHNEYDWYNNVICHAHSIYSGYTYDIKPVFRDSGLMHFNSVKRKHILHTNLALSYHFSEYFEKPDLWDICIFISERGKLFANKVLSEKKDYYQKIFSDKLIISISCQEAVAKLLNYKEKIMSSRNIDEIIEMAKQEFGYDSLNVNYRLLPYWRHHHHMILFLKTSTSKPYNTNNSYIEVSKDKYLHPIRSIYYFKQGFANVINPVIFPTKVENENEVSFAIKDQEYLLMTFYAHYLKSVVYQNSGKFIPVIKQDMSFDLENLGSIDEPVHDTSITYEKFLNCLFEKNMKGLNSFGELGTATVDGITDH